MSRTLTSDVNTALQAAHALQTVFVQLELDSGTLYLCNAPYTVTWNGHDWLGLGRLGQIEPVEEAGQLEARSISMQMSGIPAAMVSIAMGEHYQGRTAKLWLGVYNLTTRAILADPVGPISYLIDNMTLEIGATATITLTAQSRLADWDRPRLKYFNDADQQADHPGDLFCQFAEEMVEKTIVW